MTKTGKSVKSAGGAASSNPAPATAGPPAAAGPPPAAGPADFEKLGVFYLGHLYDLGSRKSGAAAKPATTAPPAPASVSASAAPSAARPMLPPDITQHFLPLRGARASALVYQPMLLDAARVRFTDAKRAVDVAPDSVFLTAITDAALAVDWEQAREVTVALGDLETEPAAGAEFAELPGIAGKKRSFEGWKGDFAGWLFRTRRLELHVSPDLKLVSRPDESEGDFRARIQHAGREGRDEAVETEAVATKTDPGQAPLETLALKPTKQNIAVRLVALAWAPHRRDAQGALAPAWE